MEFYNKQYSEKYLAEDPFENISLYFCANGAILEIRGSHCNLFYLRETQRMEILVCDSDPHHWNVDARECDARHDILEGREDVDEALLDTVPLCRG